MASYTATFDRVGRRHGPLDVPFEAKSQHPDDVSEALYRAVRKLGAIGSSELEAVVDLGAMTADLYVGGFRSAGSATLVAA